MKITSILTLAFGLAIMSGVAATSHALPVSPISYDMPNGYGESVGGEYNYWDSKYTGSGSKITDGAYLSGGLGELTDGVIATKSWEYLIDPPNKIYGTAENFDGTGPYVGWSWGDPTITFHFNHAAIKTMTFFVDDPAGDDLYPNGGHGGVSAPFAFIVNGTEYEHFSGTKPSPAQGPLAMTTDLTALNLTDIDTLTVTLKRNNAPNIYWVFASEVAFDDGRSPVPTPEPSTVALFGAGLAGLALLRNRQKK